MLNYALEDFNENPKKYKTIDDKQNILFKNLQNNKKVYEGKLTEKIKDKKLQKAIDDLYKSVVQFGKHPSVRKNQKIIAGLIVPMTQGIVKMEKQLGEGKLTEAKETPVEVARRIVQNKQYEKYKGMMLDTFTASAIVKVYDAVNDANKKKLDSLKLPKLVSVVWKLLKR